VLKSGQPIGKLGFLAAKKKVESPIEKIYKEEKTVDVDMEPSSEFANSNTKKKLYRESESDSDKKLSDTQKSMEDMEINKPTRRNRKRNLIQ